MADICYAFLWKFMRYVEDVMRRCQQCNNLYAIGPIENGELLMYATKDFSVRREGYCGACRNDILNDLKLITMYLDDSSYSVPTPRF